MPQRRIRARPHPRFTAPSPDILPDLETEIVSEPIGMKGSVVQPRRYSP